MASETVTLNVRQATEWDRADVIHNPMAYDLENPLIPIWQQSVAEVAAVFTMANPTSEAVSMTVWFPLASALETDEWEAHIGEVVPRIEDFQVAVDGTPLACSTVELPNPQGEDKPPLPWANFPVVFPAGDELIIEVSYVIWAQPDISGVGMTLHYIFQTGAGWAGEIGRAELEVNLPYLASAETIGTMPDGGQVDGNQVRWTWEDLEPSPQDDFSIWLIRQERWEEVEAARIRVSNWPDNGEAWLDLADTYRRLVLGRYQILPGFGDAFQPLGVQAAREALRLMPRDGRPHYELAIFHLSVLPEDPTPVELEPVLDELRIVEELSPSYAPDVHDWLEFLVDADQWVSLNADWATQTAEAALVQAPPTRPVPLGTPQPMTTLPAGQPASTSSNGQLVVPIAGAGAIGIIVLIYLGLKRTRGSKNR